MKPFDSFNCFDSFDYFDYFDTPPRKGGLGESFVYFSIGSNLGDKERNLRQAIDEIQRSVGTVLRQSTFIRTAPIGFDSANDFLNAAILVKTTLSPEECLTATQHIERAMGRRKKSINGVHFDRIIDIDILLYDDIQMETPDLTIPHPRMFERDFVMKPLREIGFSVKLTSPNHD